MSSIVTIMGLTSYNPYKEAITMLIGGTGPYLITSFSSLEALYPKLTALEKLFLEYARDFLSLPKKSTLTKYTWVLLKNVPTSLALSKGLSLIAYFV